jgi:hypothetical protein
MQACGCAIRIVRGAADGDIGRIGGGPGGKEGHSRHSAGASCRQRFGRAELLEIVGRRVVQSNGLWLNPENGIAVYVTPTTQQDQAKQQTKGSSQEERLHVSKIAPKLKACNPFWPIFWKYFEIES